MADSTNNTHLSPLRDQNGNIIDPAILVLNEELISSQAQIIGIGSSGSTNTSVHGLFDEHGDPIFISVFNETLVSSPGDIVSAGNSGSRSTHLTIVVDVNGVPVPGINGEFLYVENEELNSGDSSIIGVGRYVKIDPASFPRRVVAGTSEWDAFALIRPGDIDFFVFDFSQELGDDKIISASIECAVTETSVLGDTTPADRIQDVIKHNDIYAYVLIGDMLDGVTYTLTSTVVTNTDRVLSYSATVECIEQPDLDDINKEILLRDEFRAVYTQFTNPALYSDAAIDYWISQATLALDPVRWGQFYDQGLRLYVAHMLAINYRSTRNSGSGLIGSGVLSGKSVGGISLSYDNQFGSEDGAGNWNMTIWGTQFIHLARIAGSGPIQLAIAAVAVSMPLFQLWTALF